MSNHLLMQMPRMRFAQKKQWNIRNLESRTPIDPCEEEESYELPLLDNQKFLLKDFNHNSESPWTIGEQQGGLPRDISFLNKVVTQMSNQEERHNDEELGTSAVSQAFFPVGINAELDANTIKVANKNTIFPYQSVSKGLDHLGGLGRPAPLESRQDSGRSPNSHPNDQDLNGDDSISSISSSSTSSSSSSSSESSEHDAYESKQLDGVDEVPELPPLKDTTVETQQLILKEMQTRLAEAKLVAHQYRAQYQKSQEHSVMLVKKVSALEAKLAISENQLSKAEGAAAHNEQNQTTEDESKTPPRSPRFTLRLRRSRDKASPKDIKSNEKLEPVEEPQSPVSKQASTTTLDFPATKNDQESSATTVISNISAVIEAEKAKKEMVQRITDLQSRNANLAEKLQNLTNLYATAYNAIAQLKTAHKKELAAQSDVEMQLLNQISQLADSARHKEVKYHEHLLEKSQLIEELRFRLETIEKERQSERIKPAIISLQEENQALQLDIQTLREHNSTLEEENQELRKELHNCQEVLIPDLEQRIKDGEASLIKMQNVVRNVCDEKTLLKDTLTMSHLEKIEEMNYSHRKQMDEIKESHGFILRELQDRLRDQDNSIASMEQTCASQKKRLLQLESTNELDDIDRINGKSFENSAELEQWRTNCLHLQEKVKVLEETCTQLRQTFRDKESKLQTQSVDPEDFRNGFKSPLRSSLNPKPFTSPRGVQDISGCDDASTPKQDGLVQGIVKEQPALLEYTSDDERESETCGNLGQPRSRVDSAVSIQSIPSSDASESSLDRAEKDQAAVTRINILLNQTHVINDDESSDELWC